MASGGSSDRSFDLVSDDVLCSYDDYKPQQDPVNGTDPINRLKISVRTYVGDLWLTFTVHKKVITKRMGNFFATEGFAPVDKCMKILKLRIFGKRRSTVHPKRKYFRRMISPGLLSDEPPRLRLRRQLSYGWSSGGTSVEAEPGGRGVQTVHGGRDERETTNLFTGSGG